MNSSKIVLRIKAANPVLRVYDAAGSVIETHGHKGDFKGCS